MTVAFSQIDETVSTRVFWLYCCKVKSGTDGACCVQTLAALFSIDDITGFQITNLVELPEPYGIIFLWGFIFPALFIFVASITNFVFKDNLILKVCFPANVRKILPFVVETDTYSCVWFKLKILGMSLHCLCCAIIMRHAGLASVR